jgi:hypothetical protein
MKIGSEAAASTSQTGTRRRDAVAPLDPGTGARPKGTSRVWDISVSDPKKALDDYFVVDDK